MGIKPAVALLLALVTTMAVAQTSGREPVVFSDHGPSLAHATFNPQIDAYTFTGSLTLTGIVFVEFDMGGPHQALGNVTFEKFVPDRNQLSKLPAVVSGPFATPVKYLALDATDEQLAAAFGGKQAFERISHGRAHVVSRRVQVRVDHYTTLVQCDARGYRAHVVSVAPMPASSIVSGQPPPQGC